MLAMSFVYFFVNSRDLESSNEAEFGYLADLYDELQISISLNIIKIFNSY